MVSNIPRAKNMVLEYVDEFLIRAGAPIELINAWNSDLNIKKLVAKDKNKPKRSSSVYLFFCKDKRAEVKIHLQEKLGRNAKVTEVTEALGKLWRKLKEKDDVKEFLKPYQEQANRDKERYTREIRNYTPPLEKKNRLKDPDKPKRVRSCYIFFCQEKREQVKEQLSDTAKVTEVTVELGKIWKEFKQTATNEQMSKYRALYTQDKLRFASEMKSYKVPLFPPEAKKILVPPSRTSEVTTTEIPALLLFPPSRSTFGGGRGVCPSRSTTEGLLKTVQKYSSSDSNAYQRYVIKNRRQLKKDFPYYSSKRITEVLVKRWWMTLR